jgi:integrase
VGSNPTPRTLSSTPCSEVRYIQKIEPTVLGEILRFAFWMRRTGYRNSTVQTCIRTLKGLARRTNLLDAESVESYLANAPLSENRKTKVLEDVSRFYAHMKIPFERPRYKRIETLPFIPLEYEIDQLIAGVGQKSAAFLQSIKETAARPGEAWSIKWTDIDSERHCITLTPEKNSKPRERKISPRLMMMLNGLPHRWPYIFHRSEADPVESLDDFRRVFTDQRRKVALSLQNPPILNINFKTLRHFKATQEYHRTKDILHVMQLLGHKSIKNTLVYTHLVSFEGDEFICKTAHNVDEASKLVESGFDYVSQIDGVQLFRKRK